MEILGILLIGLVAGALGRLLVPGRQPMGIVGTMLLGVVGAVLGWWAGDALFGADTEANPLIWATIGAVVVVLLWQAFTRSRTGVHH